MDAQRRRRRSRPRWRVAGAVADVDHSRFGDGLDARRSVHQVAGDHSFAGHAEVHRNLSGEQPRTGAEPRCADLVAERGDGVHQFQRGAHGPLRVVFLDRRDAPDRHHRVADEFLDRAAVANNDRPRGVEVAAEEFAHVFRVALLRERRETDEVGEEHGHVAPFGGA